MDGDEVAAELYGLPLDEFVAARDAMAKRAKSSGSPDTATRVKTLRKPTLPAWLANQLVRAHRAEVDELVAVGDEMRNATASMDGARLRELTARRKELVDSLLARATELGDRAKQRVSHDVMDALGETLLAATADPGVAAELQRGCLTHPLRHVGFGPAGGAGDAAQVISLSQARAARGQRVGRAPSSRDVNVGDAEYEDTEPRQRETERRADRERDDAERELAQAEYDVATAEERVEDLGAELDERRQAVERAEAAVARLSAELATARQELDQALDAVQDAEDDLDGAQADAERARQRRRTAKRQL